MSFRNKLKGEWVEIKPCKDCRTYTFKKKKIIINTENETVEALYSIVQEDVIKVKWPILEEYTEHKLKFRTKDTLELIQFLPAYYGITRFEDIIVTKNN